MAQLSHSLLKLLSEISTKDRNDMQSYRNDMQTIENNLQSLNKELPSYVQDSTSFIKKIESLPEDTRDRFLVTMDV